MTAITTTSATPVLKAAVLVGGPSRGTRFRPLSLTEPKPLFPVAGRPLVYHHVAVGRLCFCHVRACHSRACCAPV